MSDEFSQSSALVHDDSPHKKIEQFLTRAFEGGQIVKIELAQVGLHGDQRIGDWTSFEGIGPDHQTMQILERAMDDARLQKGSPRYVVLMYRTHDRKADGRVWFTLAGGGHEFDGIEEMEGPTGTGILAQMMRHNEACARLSLMSSRDIIVEQRREIAEQRAHIRELSKLQFKLIDVYGKLRSEETTREVTLRKQRFEEVKQEQIFAEIRTILPIFMRHLAGDKSDMIRLSMMEDQIRTLFGTIPEETLMQFMSKLTDTQRLSLMDLNKLIASRPPSPAEAIAAKEKREREAREAQEAQEKAKGEDAKG